VPTKYQYPEANRVQNSPLGDFHSSDTHRTSRIRNQTRRDPNLISWNEAVAEIEFLDPVLHSSILQDVEATSDTAFQARPTLSFSSTSDQYQSEAAKLQTQSEVLSGEHENKAPYPCGELHCHRTGTNGFYMENDLVDHVKQADTSALPLHVHTSGNEKNSLPAAVSFAWNTVDPSYEFSDEEDTPPIAPKLPPKAGLSASFPQEPNLQIIIPSMSKSKMPVPETTTPDLAIPIKKATLDTENGNMAGSVTNSGRSAKPLSRLGAITSANSSIVTPSSTKVKSRKSIVHGIVDSDEDELSLLQDGFLLISSQPRSGFRSAPPSQSRVKLEEAVDGSGLELPVRKRAFSTFADFADVLSVEEYQLASASQPKTEFIPPTRIKDEAETFNNKARYALESKSPIQVTLGKDDTAVEVNSGNAEEPASEATSQINQIHKPLLRQENGPSVCSEFLGTTASFFKSDNSALASEKEAHTPPSSARQNIEIPDLSDIRLEGETEQSVPVYDSCDDIREKIKKCLKNGIKPSTFLQEIATCAGGKKLPYTSFINFMNQTGPLAGNKSMVYYSSYVFFEKLRLKDGMHKSGNRREMEILHPEGLHSKLFLKKEFATCTSDQAIPIPPPPPTGAEPQTLEAVETQHSSSPLTSFLTPTHRKYRTRRLTKEEDGLVKTPNGTLRRCGVDGFTCDRAFCFKCPPTTAAS
jgi:hypothetical protein